MSFHGQSNLGEQNRGCCERLKTVSDLLACGRTSVGDSTAVNIVCPMKLLVNVTIQRSVGPVHVLTSSELTMADLIAAALRLRSSLS
ncbi:hypothetical protein RND71_008923 [Anisodus tanguticus]|uniref:DUF7054 domain-containing protein n=1 Tax=Anisodus tanguticus TaxID=243964 RepID=A0AAE1VU69_9SOLA|nr:hypothetical protein RND71_008923 [Anisodus tanguticus]